MGSGEPLRLCHRFVASYPWLSCPGYLMRLLCPIILMLLCNVDRLGYQFPVSDAIPLQFVCHDLPGLSAMASQ